MPAAGNFKITVRGPYPCWSDLTFRNQEIKGIHHSELAELLFVVERAMREARVRLDKDADEV